MPDVEESFNVTRPVSPHEVSLIYYQVQQVVFNVEREPQVELKFVCHSLTYVFNYMDQFWNNKSEN